MPRLRKSPKPRKSYQRRVDLAPYQRLMRFLRWMSPELSPLDVLRMLPQSEKWNTEQLARYVADLSRAIEQSGESLATLVPWAVIGRWGWPTKSRVIEGHTMYYQEDPDTDRIRAVRPPGLPHVMLSQGIAWVGLEQGQAVLLDGQFPTVEGLCRLATFLRDVLEDLCETDISRIRQRWGERVPLVLDFFNNGEVRAVIRLEPSIHGRITPSIRIVSRHEGGTPRSTWYIEEHPQGYDFAAYCAWMIVQMIRDGHAWRVTRCTSCQAWFLRVRRERQGQPRHFCSDACRRAYHNPRRGKGANNSRPRKTR